MSQRTLGYAITAVGGFIALLAFFAMPYLAFGFLSATGSQLASAGGDYQGYAILWVEPIIAGIVLLLAVVQLYNTQRSIDTETSKTIDIGVIGLSGLTLLVILGKFLLVDTQSTTSTGAFGITTTTPALASFYGSGFWVYAIGIAAALVGGILALRAASSLAATTTTISPPSNTPSSQPPLY